MAAKEPEACPEPEESLGFKAPSKALKDPGNLSHPSQDRTSRFAVDRELRRHGFRIYSRARNQEPEWERGGLIYPESEALTLIPSSDRLGAKAIELGYYAQFE